MYCPWKYLQHPGQWETLQPGGENAIKMQVYCVLIAQLLMVVIRKKAATKKSFANMITVIRLHLMSYVELLEFIKDTYKAWRKTNNAPFAYAT